MTSLTSLLKLHPAIVSLLYVALVVVWAFLGAPARSLTPVGAAGVVCGLLAVLLHLGWIYGAYEKAARHCRRPTQRGLFWACVVGFVAVPLLQALNLDTSLIGQIAIICTGLLFIACLWAAADPIARIDEDPLSIGRRIVVFIQLFYFPIGVWFLAPKMQSVVKA